MAVAGVLVDVGRSLRESFFMFWETLWPLVLGFGLSGAVQTFVSRGAMQRRLGDRRPTTIVRASGYGMVSSSCSYAASAMAKSLFAKGADYIAAMVFMFASTNLVVELGIVLIVLMGWQFAVSEFVGGIIMIVLLASLGALWFRGRVVVEARARVGGPDIAPGHDHGAADDAPRRRRRGARRTRPAPLPAVAFRLQLGRQRHRHHVRPDHAPARAGRGLPRGRLPGRRWCRPRHGRRSSSPGHGFWTSLENVVVGPFIAIISFVCSIGNVPLAASLWKGGISFGGVISFIFADLITFPLLLIYRRYYGPRLTLRMLAVFWLLMSTAGLVTEGLFRAAGLVPTTRPTTVAPERFAWNYTTYLNLVFLALFAVLYWLYRHRDRLGAGHGYARDPVCGMQVEIAHAPAVRIHGSERTFFCSDHCAGSVRRVAHGSADATSISGNR